jgi:parallel beta-helix repeat protein
MIEANVVSFSPWSIVVESYYGSFVSDHNTIANNIIDETGCGILIDNSDNDTISSNTITNSVIGIRSTRTEYSSITRNHIMGNGTVDIGICINATSEFHNVTGNTIDSYTTGIKLYNLVTACHITSNEISGCSEYGIFMNQSSTSAVSNNIIRDSGIAIRVFLGNGTFVSENIITGSTTGVLLNSSVGTYVLSNRIVVSGSCIAVDRHCPFTTLSGNVCGESGNPADQPGLDAFVLAYAVVVTAALIVVILSWNMKARKKH